MEQNRESESKMTYKYMGNRFSTNVQRQFSGERAVISISGMGITGYAYKNNELG